MHIQFPRLQNSLLKYLGVGGIVLVVAILGTYLLIGSHAASPYASVTANNGTTSGATQQTCAGASTGSCIVFGGTISLSQGTSRSLSPDFLGFNGDASSAAWNNPALLPAITALSPGTIRGIVGGTPSNYFNWQTGQYFITATDPNLTYIKPSAPNPPYTLANYVNALQAGGANALFNLNVMTYCPVSNTDPASTAQAGVSCTMAQACGPTPSAYTTSCTNTDYTWGLNYQIALLQAAQSMGVPIKYIELGNELYISNNSDYTYYFPTVQSYINKVNAWIPVLKQDFPGAQIAVVGTPPSAGISAWNQAIYADVHGEDAITTHTYYGSTIPSGGSVDNPQQLSSMLSTATEDMASSLETNDLDPLPSGISDWVTEWNLASENLQVTHGSWAQGLTEANYAVDLIRQPQIELAVNHDLVSTQVYGSLFENTTAYSATAEAGKAIGTPIPIPPTQAFGMSEGGFTLSALERSLHGATSTTSLNFSSNPNIADSSVPGLIGQSFTVNGKTNFYFVNLSADNENLNLGDLSGNYTALQYTSSPINFVTGNGSIPTDTFTATNSLNVPAYSVTSLVSN
jgi:hypothetical protein